MKKKQKTNKEEEIQIISAEMMEKEYPDFWRMVLQEAYSEFEDVGIARKVAFIACVNLHRIKNGVVYKVKYPELDEKDTDD